MTSLMRAADSALRTRTLALCFIAATLEGGDIVSMGLAAPIVARELGFGPAQVSYILTATIVGMMIGAATGGGLGDRFGRKRVLVIAFLALGGFSLATSLAYDLSSFVGARLLCGIGIGAAFPNLIAIASEASPPERRATGVGMMFCGQPIGGTLLALFVASQSGAMDWRAIFYIGGILPLVLVPVLMLMLPESSVFQRARETGGDTRVAASATLFGGGRALMTILLWLSYGLTQIIVYLLNNWLPTLMVAKGFTPQQAGMISAFENAGAAVGCVLLAMLTDRGLRRQVLVFSYGAVALSLWALGAIEGFVPAILAGIAVGFFAIGGQAVLYAIAPSFYPTLGRATGIGAAVAFGRFGAIAGPLGAGSLLAAGFTPAAVLIAAIPFAAAAGIAALSLVVPKFAEYRD